MLSLTSCPFDGGRAMERRCPPGRGGRFDGGRNNSHDAGLDGLERFGIKYYYMLIMNVTIAAKPRAPFHQTSHATVQKVPYRIVRRPGYKR